MSIETNKRPKASRMEMQVRNNGRWLLWLSVTLLAICVAMTGMFGWSLGTDPANRTLYAIGYGATDVGGAVIMGFCGTCFALRQRGIGAMALLCALFCFAMSLSAIVGFQSASREASAVSREMALQASNDLMTWSKTTTTDRALTAPAAKKGQGDLLASGITAVGEQVEKHIKRLQTGELAPPDPQSITMGRLLGVKDADARSWNIAAFAAVLLIIQYACLWFHGFSRHRLEPQVTAANSIGLSSLSRQSLAIPANPASFAEGEARNDLDRLLASGYHIDNISFLARRWSWTPHRTRRWLDRQPDIKVPPVGRRGQRKSVERGDNFLANGNGHARTI